VESDGWRGAAIASVTLQDEASVTDTAGVVATITPREIRNIRTHLGMTCREVARAVGLEGRRAFNTVYRWERGKVPSAANVEALRRLGVSVEMRQPNPGA
jgi:DNA-binding transcriptional regulator YiaG